MAKKKKANGSKMAPMAGMSMAKEQEYQAEDDLRTLQRAEDIRSNRARLAGANKLHERQHRALTRASKRGESRR